MTGRTARRAKTLDVLRVSDTAVWLQATLRDTTVAPGDAEDVETVHALRLDALVTVPDLVIRAVRATAEEQPYEHCALSVAPVGRLVEASLTRGYRKHVMEALGGTRGCSHFLTLALDLSAANLLSIFLRLREQAAFTPGSRSDGTWALASVEAEPRLENACLALSSDSPVLEQVRALRAGSSAPASGATSP